MTGDLEDNRSVAEGGVDDDTGEESWSAAERALLDAAIDFYGAAEGVIDLSGQGRPQLRQDAAGFDAVRKSMAVIEERVRDAHAAGVTPERIAQIARIEQEMVVLILARRDGAAAPSSTDS